MSVSIEALGIDRLSVRDRLARSSRSGTVCRTCGDPDDVRIGTCRTRRTAAKAPRLRGQASRGEGL